MNKNFALYLKKANNHVKHKSPPVFDRKKYQKVEHKTPPEFKRPALDQGKPHRTPPPFTRPEIGLAEEKSERLLGGEKETIENLENFTHGFDQETKSQGLEPISLEKQQKSEGSFGSGELSSSSLAETAGEQETKPLKSVSHKTPPVFVRPRVFEDQEKKVHKKPPIFSKFPASIRTEFLQNRIKNSGSWSFADTVSEEAKDSFFNESSAEMSSGFFNLRGSSKAANPLSRSSLADSAKVKDDLKKIEPSASIESAIMHLHSEVQEFPSFKESENNETKELCNFDSSSDYSSGLSKEKESIPMPSFNYFGMLQLKLASPQVTHKTPPAFNRKAKETQKTIQTIVSSLSNSASISPISSVSNSPDSRISRILENQSPGHHALLNDYPNAFISGMSNVSPEKTNKGLLKLKSSFIGESFEKSRNLSPFVSNNFFDRPFVIPVKPVSYFERTTENSGIKFCDFSQLPEVPEYEKVEFNYPSVRNGMRGSSNTIFSQTADLPDNIRLNVNLSHSLKQSVKPSKYSLKASISSKEIDFMAKKLAKDLIERDNYY